MNKQSILNFVCDKLVEQGKPSLSNSVSGVCAYRSSDGFKCAAGHLIDDDSYDERFEGYSCESNNVKNALKNSGIPEDLIPFVSSLQKAHDLAWDDCVIEESDNRLGIIPKDCIIPKDSWLKYFTKRISDISKDNDLIVPNSIKPYIKYL